MNTMMQPSTPKRVSKIPYLLHRANDVDNPEDAYLAAEKIIWTYRISEWAEVHDLLQIKKSSDMYIDNVYDPDSMIGFAADETLENKPFTVFLKKYCQLKNDLTFVGRVPDEYFEKEYDRWRYIITEAINNGVLFAVNLYDIFGEGDEILATLKEMYTEEPDNYMAKFLYGEKTENYELIKEVADEYQFIKAQKLMAEYYLNNKHDILKALHYLNEAGYAREIVTLLNTVEDQNLLVEHLRKMDKDINLALAHNMLRNFFVDK